MFVVKTKALHFTISPSRWKTEISFAPIDHNIVAIKTVATATRNTNIEFKYRIVLIQVVIINFCILLTTMTSRTHLNNGQIRKSALPQRSSVSQYHSRTEKPNKAVPDMPAIETNNWNIHKHYIRHEYELCKKLINHEIQNSNGKNEYANYLSGIILRKEGRVQSSLEAFEKCCDINASNLNNFKQRAKSLSLLGNYEHALEIFLEAANLSDQTDWEIYHSIGECYIKLNKLDDGIKNLKKATELTKNQEPFITLANVYKSQNEISEALKVYTQAIKNTPENADLAVELGMLFIKLGDYKRAFQQFGAAVAMFPTMTQSIIPMTYIIQNNNEFDVALSKYKSASLNMPESWILWNNVGMCFHGKQKFVAAISCLKRAHYLNPLAMYPVCNLGIVALQTGQPASAAIYLTSAVSLSPDAVLPRLLLALALNNLHDTVGAERAFTKALALAPDNYLVLINYAIFLEAEGQYDKAREMLTVLNDASVIINMDDEVLETAKKLSHCLHNKSKQTGSDSVLNLEEDQV